MTLSTAPKLAIPVTLLCALGGCVSQPSAPRAPAAAGNEVGAEAPRNESEPAALPSSPWTPPVPEPAAAGEVAWAEVSLTSACAAPPSSETDAAPVTTITTEAAFSRAYCRTSSVDWSRFRLVTISLTDTGLVQAVVRDAPYHRVFLHLQPSCETSWGNQLHLLLPAEDAPIVVAKKKGTEADCLEGYGY